MYLFYFDEVKLDPKNQKSFWLGGVCVEASSARTIEARCNKIAAKWFTDEILDVRNEFHGKDIVHGKGNFKGVPIEKRAELYGELLDLLVHEEVKRYYIKINPENFVMTAESPDEIAFMFLVEQINKFLEKEEDIGMMFGDYDEPVIGGSVISLSKFKKQGTYWARSTTVDRIIDTVHFAKSHHSRMIQLADVYLHARQLWRWNESAPWKKKFCDQIRNSGILNTAFAKEWPVERIWYR